jgi:gluconolactonase
MKHRVWNLLVLCAPGLTVLPFVAGGAQPVVAAEPAPALPGSIGKIERFDPAFNKLVAPDAKIEVLGGGFEWSEGVVWVAKEGHALFSDIPPNKIMKWTPGEGISQFAERIGYTGKEPFKGTEPGTNGITLDSQGRLVMCCHGDRCIKRMERDGSLTTLVSEYEGKRLNSPNDLVYHSNGDLYFTDPPYGLPDRENDKGRELDWFGVYRLSRDGKLTLLTKEMTRPNGIGFSPDQKTLYVAQSDPDAAIWKAFPVKSDGTLGDSKQLFDSTDWVKQGLKGLPDGLAVDAHGNLWATAPGGVIVLTSQGKLLGRLNTGEATANCKFAENGDLLICADMYFCRVKTLARGR